MTFSWKCQFERYDKKCHIVDCDGPATGAPGSGGRKAGANETVLLGARPGAMVLA